MRKFNFAALFGFVAPSPKPRKNFRRRLGIEVLEDRRCLAIAPFTVVGSMHVGEAAAQPTVEVGTLNFESQALNIDDPRGALLNTDGSGQQMVTVVGNEAGRGWQETVTVSTGVVSSPTAFTSLAGVANTRTSAFAISRLTDGRMIVGGNAATQSVYNTPTYWFVPDAPISAATFASDAGNVEAIIPLGSLFGSLNNPASVGSVTQAMVNLAGASGGTGAVDASTDGTYLVGTMGIYVQGTPGDINSYTRLDTSSFATPATGLAPPDAWLEAEQYGSSNTGIVVGNFLTESFGTNVAGYNPVTGALVFTGQEGDALVDARTYGSGTDTVTIVMVQGVNGPAVYTSNNGFQTRVELEPAFGAGTTVTALPGTMHDLGLGFIANVNGEPKVVSFGLTITPVQTVRQIDSTVRNNLYPAGYISPSRGGSTFEVLLPGSADFNVNLLDKSSLFIGDAGNATSARILRYRYGDFNRDGSGFRDVIITVQTRTAFTYARRAADEVRTLKITGKLTDGTEFDASTQVTLTNKAWYQVWIDTTGRNWYSSFWMDRRRGWRL